MPHDQYRTCPLGVEKTLVLAQSIGISFVNMFKDYQTTSKKSMKSRVSDMNIGSLVIGSAAEPSSSHLIGTDLPVPAVLCQVVLSVSVFLY